MSISFCDMGSDPYTTAALFRTMFKSLTPTLVITRSYSHAPPAPRVHLEALRTDKELSACGYTSNTERGKVLRKGNAILRLVTSLA